jgi:murein DD-endopeptidase MepM/ murein hydrolase activator NlpD
LGSTGDSTGPHVHFAVRIHGVPVDPASVLRC